MSNIENNVRKMPHTHPNEFTCFAIVVEGEVASYVTHPNTDELHIAIHRSAPIFIEVPYLETAIDVWPILFLSFDLFFQCPDLASPCLFLWSKSILYQSQYAYPSDSC